MNRSVTPVCHPVPPPPQRLIPRGLACYLAGCLFAIGCVLVLLPRITI